MNLEELKSKAEQAIELAKKATDGPWTFGDRAGIIHLSGKLFSEICKIYKKTNSRIIEDPESNGQFIAASRTLIPELAEGVLELIHQLEKSEKDLGDLGGACLAKAWKESFYTKENAELIEKLKVAEEALEYVARGPRIDDSDSTVAKQALKKIRGEADES